MPSTQPLRLLSAREAVSKRTEPRVALLIMQNVRLHKMVSRVMKALGMETFSTDDLNAAHSWIENSRPDLLIYDIDSETPESRMMLTRMSHQEEAPSLILLSEGGDAPLLRDLISYPRGYNLVLKEGLIDNGDLLVTARKLVNRDIFGIDKYLRWGSVIHTSTVGSSDDKNEIVGRVEDFMVELGCERRYISDLANTMDEFVTNAFFHAPTEEGVQVNSQRPRSHIITLPSWKRPTIEYGSDGRFVGIACRDPFGSLDTRTMLEHLATCAEMGLAEVSSGPGGAGIGLYTTYRTVDHLIINLEAGVATEFVAIVDITLPYREHIKLPRTLNVFTLEPFTD